MIDSVQPSSVSRPPSPPSLARTVALPRARRGTSSSPSVSATSGELVLTSADLSLVDARPAQPIADPLLGRTIADRYRIVEPIGRGGMGCVYKVEHTRIGKLLAMKLLSGELSTSPDAVRRFKREALTVSRLQCPNTVQVFDFGVSGGLTYLVMELVSGDNLGRIARAEGPMPFSRVGRIIVQVLSALAEAHGKGIVHRDIKPENIMLVAARNGDAGADVVKVLDFGLAKLREAEGLNDETRDGIIVGTPNYMAPEQIRGEHVDARTDVYSAGALMYRLLTGHTPFHAESPMGVLEKHLHECPIPPAERAPDLGIPPGVSRVVMRALRKDPQNRFQRAEDMQAELVRELRAVGGGSVETLLDPRRLRRLAVPAALATRDEVDAYERKLRRTRWGAALGAVLVTLGAAGAGLSLAYPLEPRSRGEEIEPNDTAAEATPLALGQAMTGQIGKRLDATRGDRDFYVFDLPAASPAASGLLSLRVSGVPSMALCTLLYRSGFADPVGQYCVGRPGHDLVVPALSLEPGRYFLAVLEDLDPYGGAPAVVHESISDRYTIVAETAAPGGGVEVEPNDTLASATQLELDHSITATIGWARDEDFFCVSPAALATKFRWRLRPGAHEGGVLEGTPVDGQRCLRVRLGPPRDGSRYAERVSEPYLVEAETTP